MAVTLWQRPKEYIRQSRLCTSPSTPLLRHQTTKKPHRPATSSVVQCRKFRGRLRTRYEFYKYKFERKFEPEIQSVKRVEKPEGLAGCDRSSLDVWMVCVCWMRYGMVLCLASSATTPMRNEAVGVVGARRVAHASRTKDYFDERILRSNYT